MTIHPYDPLEAAFESVAAELEAEHETCENCEQESTVTVTPCGTFAVVTCDSCGFEIADVEIEPPNEAAVRY